jgi:septum site-determining protein MinD
MTRYIAITSGKGGTGKTTLAVNLGTALAQFKRNSIVVDANLTSPNVALQLGSINPPTTLHDVLNGTKNIRETAYSHPSGLKIIPANINQESVEVHTLKEAIQGLEGTTELAIIDTAPGSGKDTQEAINAADSIIVVTNPETTAVTEALKTITKARKEGKQIMGAVLNRVTGDGLELAAQNVEKILGCNVIATIEEDINVKKALKQKHPVVYLYPNSRASLSYKKLAAQLIGEDYEQGLNKKRGIFSWQEKN